MEKFPYKPSATNPRMMEDVERSPKVLYATAAIFLFSLHCYNRRWFRKDGNVLNAALFTLGSAPASWSYASYFFSSPEIEAGLINNANERQH
jgi:hypothetical protein